MERNLHDCILLKLTFISLDSDFGHDFQKPLLTWGNNFAAYPVEITKVV